MSDTISRQAAIDAIEITDWYHQNAYKDMVSGANPDLHQAWYKADDVYNALESVPSAQPEPKWIPCSERLPRKNGFYICTTKDCITILEFRDGNPHYHEKPSFVSDVLGRCNAYVVAWMPLPEPYKEGADE